jgi:hypothetical protein
VHERNGRRRALDVEQKQANHGLSAGLYMRSNMAGKYAGPKHSG